MQVSRSTRGWRRGAFVAVTCTSVLTLSCEQYPRGPEPGQASVLSRAYRCGGQDLNTYLEQAKEVLSLHGMAPVRNPHAVVARRDASYFFIFAGFEYVEIGLFRDGDSQPTSTDHSIMQELYRLLRRCQLTRDGKVFTEPDRRPSIEWGENPPPPPPSR